MAELRKKSKGVLLIVRAVIAYCKSCMLFSSKILQINL